MKHNLWKIMPEILVNIVFDLVASFILLGLGATMLHFMTLDKPLIIWVSVFVAIIIVSGWRTLTLSYSRT